MGATLCIVCLGRVSNACVYLYGQQLAYVLFWCLWGFLQENLSVWFLLRLSEVTCTVFIQSDCVVRQIRKLSASSLITYMDSNVC